MSSFTSASIAWSVAGVDRAVVGEVEAQPVGLRPASPAAARGCRAACAARSAPGGWRCGCARCRAGGARPPPRGARSGSNSSAKRPPHDGALRVLAHAVHRERPVLRPRPRRCRSPGRPTRRRRDSPSAPARPAAPPAGRRGPRCRPRWSRSRRTSACPRLTVRHLPAWRDVHGRSLDTAGVPTRAPVEVPPTRASRERLRCSSSARSKPARSTSRRARPR